VRIRAARPGIKPTLMVPIPKAIIDKLNIVEGQTFAMFVESDNSLRVVRTKP
jgi:antitoxin component of MazEF toxin-antitoxin module